MSWCYVLACLICMILLNLFFLWQMKERKAAAITGGRIMFCLISDLTVKNNIYAKP